MSILIPVLKFSSKMRNNTLNKKQILVSVEAVVYKILNVSFDVE